MDKHIWEKYIESTSIKLFIKKIFKTQQQQWHLKSGYIKLLRNKYLIKIVVVKIC